MLLSGKASLNRTCASVGGSGQGQGPVSFTMVVLAVDLLLVEGVLGILWRVLHRRTSCAHLAPIGLFVQPLKERTPLVRFRPPVAPVEKPLDGSAPPCEPAVSLPSVRNDIEVESSSRPPALLSCLAQCLQFCSEQLIFLAQSLYVALLCLQIRIPSL